jgi:hypothetical protein
VSYEEEDTCVSYISLLFDIILHVLIKLHHTILYTHTHTHTHTHLDIYIYNNITYIYIYACMYV